jgi:hypothetical protein
VCDLLGHRRGGQFAIELRQAAHPAAVAGEAAGAGARNLVHRRQREQAAARAVEVARGDVDQLDQPLAQRAEALRRHAHAAVADRRIGGGELPGDASDRLRGDTAVLRGALRGEVREGLCTVIQAA